MTENGRPQILLVDDVPLLREAISRTLEGRYELALAESAAEALELLEARHSIGVVVADYGMPGMNGLELLEECARAYPSIARILWTGKPEVEMARDAIQGADVHRFLLKPCQPKELLEAVESAIGLHERTLAQELEARELAFSNESLRLLNRNLEQRILHRDESIQHLRRLGIEMNTVSDLGHIARAAASACHQALGRRGVCVQIFGPEGGMAECSLGPEMSMRMISEPLVTKDGPIGEVTVDVLSPEGRQITSPEQNLLAAMSSLTAVAAHNEFRRRERDEAQYATVVALARLSEQRDQETGQHLERVSEFCRLIAESLVRRGQHTDLITPAWIHDLERSAPLHDIGKVGIPDSILLKKGKLTAGEWEVMKTHSEIGAETLRSVTRTRHAQSYLEMGLDIALCHHEKWDGSGYPAGLAGGAIPLSARILALADVYDALTSCRPYKGAWSHEEALALIQENSGSHFDPEVVAGFLERAPEIDEVRQRLADDDPDPKRILGPIGRSA